MFFVVGNKEKENVVKIRGQQVFLQYASFSRESSHVKIGLYCCCNCSKAFTGLQPRLSVVKYIGDLPAAVPD